MTRAWRIAGGDGTPWRVEPTELELAAAEDDTVVVAVEATSLGVGYRAMVPGRAAVGRVVDAGAGARHLDGARVLVGSHQPCGDCDVCRRGGAPVCPAGRTLGVDAPGGLAERVTARARWVLRLDGELELPGSATAVLGHEAGLAYALYARAGVGPREPTIVLGAGPVARLLVEVLIAKSAPPLLVTSEPALAGWAASRDLSVIEPPGDDVVALGEALRGAADARGHGRRPWKLFETDGDPAIQAQALAVAGPRATVAVVAPTGVGVIDLGAALGREVTVIGVRGAHPDLLPELAALAVRGELDLAAAAEIVELGALAATLDRGAGSRAVVVSISPGS